MKDIQKIQWKRIGAEAAAIVVSILLAFGIDAWWGNRAEEILARKYVDYLIAEARENLQGLHDLVIYHDGKKSQTIELIGLLASDNPQESNDRIRRLVLDVMYFGGYQPVTSALDNIIGDGGLGQLNDPQTQLAISQYAQAIKDHNLLQAELADLVVNDFTVFLADRIPFLAVGFAGRALPDAAPESAFVFDAMVLVGSMEFENMMVRRIVAEDDAARYARHLIQVAEKLIAQLEPIS